MHIAEAVDTAFNNATLAVNALCLFNNLFFAALLALQVS